MKRPPRVLLMIVVMWMGIASWVAPVSAQIDARVLAQRSSLHYDRVPRHVLAFYYPWYGSLGLPKGHWVHWRDVDEAKHHIGSSTHYPQLGPYDSLDPKVIDQHCVWAKQAGIDTLIVSWWGPGDQSDKAMPLILAAAKRHGLHVSAYIERVPEPMNAESAAKSIVGLLNDYAGDAAWLRVDNKPVVFVYGRAVNQIQLDGWLDAIGKINRMYQGGAAIIGDQLTGAAAHVFDGIHTYNPVAGLVDPIRDHQVAAWAKQAYATWVDHARQYDRISTITIIPGYDDREIRTPGIAADRLDGDLYTTEWKQAIAANPDWVVITSFNEWHEGSEIEPSVEFGDKYLKLTAKFATQFMAMPPVAVQTHQASQRSLSAAELANLRTKLEGLKVGMLPDTQSPAAWWLIGEVGLRPVQLTWADVAAGKANGLDMLLYTGGEIYTQSVHEHGDVDAALRAYLHGGGTLVVMPAGPMPFHYDSDHQTVGASREFGLHLLVGGPANSTVHGFEQPPADANLHFVRDADAMTHTPATLAFPPDGDRRWRPFDPAGVKPTTDYHPLLTLKDASGASHGDGAVLLHFKSGPLAGGRVAYVWYRLLDGPHADAVMDDVLRVAARK